MSMVWPCPLTVDAYVAAGREVLGGDISLWPGLWFSMAGLGVSGCMR